VDAGKLVIPLNREAPNFRSMIALIDGRTELKPMMAEAGKPADNVDLESGESGTAAAVPLVEKEYANQPTYSILEVTMMASKIAYENAAYIENVVNNVWKVRIYIELEGLLSH
jgi:hypothetical protein